MEYQTEQNMRYGSDTGSYMVQNISWNSDSL